METESRYIAVGSFVLVLLLGIIGFTIWASKIDWDKSYIYEIYFSGSVAGLREGEMVNYNGVPIGKVKKIDINCEKIDLIRVVVGIYNPSLIREDSYATLETKGLTGIVFVQIHGSTSDSPILKSKKRQTYPIIPSQGSKIQELIEATPKILHKLVILVDQVTPFFSEENRKAINISLKNVSTFTSTLAASSSDAKTFFSETQKMAKSISETMSILSKRVDNSGQKLENTLNQIEQLIQENRPYISGFTSEGLYEATQTLTELRILIRNLSRILDRVESSPARFFFQPENHTQALD
ncbi:MAG: MCE family protein [Alphaproteobacteria bacterium]|nr:MCE family protein [Alphaproteobacteria bacterium]